MVREGWYVVWALMATAFSPAYLLATPRVEPTVTWKLAYVLAPEMVLCIVFMGDAAHWGGFGVIAMLVTWALDVVGVIAFITASGSCQRCTEFDVGRSVEVTGEIACEDRSVL
jgi:hypothetical protein